MEIDYKQQFNDSMDRVANIISESYFPNPKTQEFERLTEAYRKEVQEWMTNKGAEEDNPLTTATQQQWYTLYLEKKRLQKLGISVDYKKLGLGHWRSKKTSRAMYTKEGPYACARLIQPVLTEKEYQKKRQSFSFGEKQ